MDYDRLRELQEKFEENPRRYFAPLANEYRKGGQPKRAIEICRSQLSQMPGHMSGQIVFGQALYETGEFDEARQVFERALTLDPENLIALRSLGDMSLQSGNTAEARRWYARLLDADPKDTAVVALVTEIDASPEAAPVPTPEEIPGIDADLGDQAIPFIADQEGAPVDPENAPSTAVESAPSTASESAPPAAFESALRAAIESAPPAPHAAFETTEPSPPIEPNVSSETASAPEPIAASAPASPSSAGSEAAPPPGLERHYPVESVDAIVPDVGMGAEGLRSGRQDEPMGAEGLRGTEPESPEPIGAEGLSGKPPVLPLAGAKGSRSDDEDALDTWTPPPDVAAPARVEPRVPERVESRAPERAESRKEEATSSGPGPEPFVNETMAQLYLQQGYRQLALRVYYQLAESRPNDQALKDRIAEIEAADHAAHPELAEAPPVDRSPVNAPPAPLLSRHREPAEAPARAAPRAEPESIGARQPSIREFFATLGRRRPPRSAGNSSGGSRTSNNARGEAGASIGSVPPGASLDEVFAGATVSLADSRAASRLAGAFSGAAGTSRTSPPTPPMPTPRVNPRVPQAQESEEDVAKFRAWLDGLTGE